MVAPSLPASADTFGAICSRRTSGLPSADGDPAIRLDGNDTVTIQVKTLRAELLSVKADLERELGRIVSDCAVRGKCVDYVARSASKGMTVYTRNPNRTSHRSLAG